MSNATLSQDVIKLGVGPVCGTGRRQLDRIGRMTKQYHESRSTVDWRRERLFACIFPAPRAEERMCPRSRAFPRLMECPLNGTM
jgi:hypothetical protein